MKKTKVIGLILGIVLFLFGFLGFFSAFATSVKTVQETFEKARPINEKNGLAVDSEGNFYVGDAQGSYIQVFDKTGKFKYGFTFETGGSGWFAFGIDENNVLHIVTARTESHLQFSNGLLIAGEKITYEQRKTLEEKYNMSDGNYFESEQYSYYLVSEMVRIAELSSDVTSKSGSKSFRMAFFNNLILAHRSCRNGFILMEFRLEIDEIINQLT